MLLEHNGFIPQIHETAYIAPNATVSGNVTIEEDVRILFGAVITSEGSPIVIRRGSIIMENAVLRSYGNQNHPYPLTIGENVLIGPHAYLSGCTIGDHSFVAASAKVYNGASIGAGSILAIGGIVHVNCVLPEQSRIPIQHVAIGTPANVYSPVQATEINEELQKIDFLSTIFGEKGDKDFQIRLMSGIEKYNKSLSKHSNDKVL